MDPDRDSSQIMYLGIVFFVIICMTKFSVVVIAIAIVFTLFMYLISKRDVTKNYFKIDFDENQVTIQYLKRDTSVVIPYQAITHVRYSRYKAKRFNRITYIQDTKTVNITYLSVADDNSYIEFLQWIQNKNNAITFDAYPPDESMEFNIQRTFGFKYRKMLKDSL